MAENADSVWGYFGRVVACSHCVGGRNVQIGAGPNRPCEDCDGTGLVLVRDPVDTQIDSSDK